MTKIHEVTALGQSIWLDYIRRSLMTSGELAILLKNGVSGLTSNPTIFEKAIAGSTDYDTELQRLAKVGKTAYEIYEALAIEDIRMAADALRHIYEQSKGIDGYVSFEVNPELAHDFEGTVCEGRRLFAAVYRPNIMIKVPATVEGVMALEQLISEGININATLIFSEKHYRAIAEAYLRGLEKLVSTGGHPEQIASVASLFVSRLDVVVDSELEKCKRSDLAGQAAIANAKLVYAAFQNIFSGPRWDKLVDKGAKKQRLLLASTGTKNPNYSNTLYVDSLIGPDTIDTLAPATLDAFLDHGKIAETLVTNIKGASDLFTQLEAVGIAMPSITEQLQKDAVASFAKSYKSLLESIEKKRNN